jgi:hypothetical protein
MGYRKVFSWTYARRGGSLHQGDKKKGGGAVRRRVIERDGHVIERRIDLERYGWQGSATELIEMLLSSDDREAWGTAIRTGVRDGVRPRGAPAGHE